MYKIEMYQYGAANKYVLLDHATDTFNILSAQLEQQEDNIDSVTLTIMHDFLTDNDIEIVPLKTLIKVTDVDKSKVVFKGRALAPESTMDSSGKFGRQVVFEGKQAYLKDTLQKYSFEFDKMPYDNLKLLIDFHNAQLLSEPYKQFKIGIVNVEKNLIPKDEEYNEELKYFKRWEDKNTFETIEGDLIGKYEGHIVVEYADAENGDLIHYVKDTGKQKMTKIEIAHNLQSIQYKVDPTEIITRVKPLGSTSETANGDELRLTIADANGGSPYIDIPELQAVFGIQTGIADFPEVYTPVTLKERAMQFVEEQKKKAAKVTISLDALDLFYAGLENEKFEMFGIYETIVPQLDIHEDLKIVGLSTDLLNPQNAGITIGEKEYSLAELQNKEYKRMMTTIVNNNMINIAEIGGISREQAIYRDLAQGFENLKVSHSRLLADINETLNNPYLTQAANKTEINNKLSGLIVIYNAIKRDLEAITEDTATVDNLLPIQQNFALYNANLENMNKAINDAKVFIAAEIKNQQRNYTDVAVKDFMQNVADRTGLTYDAVNKRLVGDVKLTTTTIDNAWTTINNKIKGSYVSSTTYTTDMNGVVTTANDAKSLAEQTAKEIKLEVSNSAINTQLRTLTQAVSAIKLLADGISLTSNSDGRLSSVDINPNAIKLKSKLIEIGTEPNSPSEVTISGGLAYIRNMSFDKIQGGNLILGGTVNIDDPTKPMIYETKEDGTQQLVYQKTAKKFENVSFNLYDNDGFPTVSIDGEGAFINELETKSISAEYVEKGSAIASVSTEDKTFYIARYLTESEANDPTFDGSSNSKPLHYSNIMNVMPDILNHEYTLLISSKALGAGNVTDNFEIKGVQGSGKITIDANGVNTYFAFKFINCRPDIILTNTKTTGTNYFDVGSADTGYHIQNVGCNNVDVNNLVLEAINGDGNIGVRSTYVGYTNINDCYFTGYNDAIRGEYGATVYTKNNDGRAFRFGTSSFTLSTVAIDTLGVSSFNAGGSYYQSGTGTIKLTQNPVFLSTPTSGNTAPAPKTPTATYKTTSWSATAANNFYGSFWMPSTDAWFGRVVSGQWSGYPSQSGIWIFPSGMKSTLKGKTISKVTITLTRQTKYGYTKAIPVTLRMHNYSSLPTGSTSPAMGGGAKEISFKQGETRTIDITSTFKDSLASGNYAGFGLRSSYDMAHYASFSKNAKVTVTYK